MADRLSLDRLRPVRATIDLSRLAANYQALAGTVPVPLMPVIKADAYGHGAAQVGRTLERLGVPMLAVAYVDEALALREAGIRVPIVVLAGFTPAQVPLLVERALTPVVSTPATLEAVLGASSRLAVHVKVDTGMTRLGFSVGEIDGAVRRLIDSRRIEVAGLMTHLASADEDAGFTNRQLDIFDTVIARLGSQGLRPPYIHAANSAGMAFHRPTHTLVRPGLLLYGVKPRPLTPAADVKPVMAVSAEVAVVRDVPAGTAVSYGGRFVAARPSRIAVLPIGYADGVPRTAAYASNGRVVIRGRSVPVVGTVCMDLTMADVTDHPDVVAGDTAVLLGDAPDAWDVAGWAGTNGWDSLTRIGRRVPRVYVEEGRIIDVLE